MIKKRAILFTTFGSTRSEVMEPILDCFVSEGADRWPDRWIEAVITGEHVRRALAEQGVSTESLEEALDRLSDEGFVEVTVQPLLINDGGEYEKVRRRIQAYVDRTLKIIKIRLGRPLLWSHADMERLADILCAGTAADPEEPSQKIVYIGHGTGGSSDERYRILERKFADRGRSDICIELLKSKRISAEGCRKPLMLMAGAHAEEAQCELTGLGENPLIRSIFLDHAEQATLIRKNSNPLEALVLAARTEQDPPLTETANSLGLDESKILACTDMRQALMIQELQAQEMFPDCELEIVEGALEDILAMIDGQDEYGGVIVGYGDLQCFGLEHRARAIFTQEEIVPPMGAGSVNVVEAMAMQGFLYEIQEPNPITTVYAEGDQDGLELWALYYDEISGQWWTDWIAADPEDPMTAGREFAIQIRQGGQWAEGDDDGQWTDDEE